MTQPDDETIFKDDWAFYFCRVNGCLASIYLNLGLRAIAPIKSKPWLPWVWVYFQSPRADGLSDSAEAPTLFAVEDSLNQHVCEDCVALPCGRITTEGRREFYFYAERPQEFRSALSDAMAAAPEYKFATGDQEEQQWQQYFNVLYPSAIDLKRIGNRNLLDRLLEKGDLPTLAREVEHWASFSTESSRTSFKEAAEAQGFTFVWRGETDKDLPFEISVSRIQTVDIDALEETAIKLFKLALEFDGEYDGWETPVTSLPEKALDC